MRVTGAAQIIEAQLVEHDEKDVFAFARQKVRLEDFGSATRHCAVRFEQC